MHPTANLFDATHENIGSLPKGGYYAGYVTGSGGVPWNQADWNAHPGAVRIAQSPVESIDEASDADVLDYETGAATDANLVPWSKKSISDFHAGIRPSQRRPTLYASRSNITHIANVLVSGGITSGICLRIAQFNNDVNQATAEVAQGSGPFPVVWRQYANHGAFDAGIVSLDWLNDVSRPPVRTVAVPDVTGDRAGDAHNILAGDQLVPVAVAGQRATEVVTGTVPVAGTIVAVGTRVQIITGTTGIRAGVLIDTGLGVTHVTSHDGGKTWG